MQGIAHHSRLARARSPRWSVGTLELAYVAAALALAGLPPGKTFIFVGSTNQVTDDFLDDEQLRCTRVAHV